ncbi:MAG: phosphotransferase family protein [Janthinobacterium lividum]
MTATNSATPSASASPAVDFDVARLEEFLRPQLPAFSGALQVSRCNGGQSNPTFRLNAGARRYILRSKPPGKLLSSAHAIEREYRVISALEGSPVPVPRTLLFCDDLDVINRSFYLMDCVDGRILGDQTLPDVSRAERGLTYESLVDVMAALHRVDYRAIGLADYGKEGDYVARQITRWTRQYRDTETRRVEAMERLMSWLPENIPPQTDTAIVHGDYRLDNVVLHPTEPRLMAVLDWELSTLGDPLVDFAHHCITWRLGLGVHRTLAGADLPALGIPTEAAYLAAYCERTGRSVSQHDWEFYLALCMFRLAAIQQGILKRTLDGNANNPSRGDAIGKRVEATSGMAWQIAERLAH